MLAVVPLRVRSRKATIRRSTSEKPESAYEVAKMAFTAATATIIRRWVAAGVKTKKLLFRTGVPAPLPRAAPFPCAARGVAAKMVDARPP